MEYAWSQMFGSSEELERELGMTYLGPGWYESGSDTTLVLEQEVCFRESVVRKILRAWVFNEAGARNRLRELCDLPLHGVMI